MELIQSSDISLLIRIKSIECIGRLSIKCDFNAYTSRIIHPLIHIINTYPTSKNYDQSLFNATMSTLCLIMIKMGKDYLIFVPMIQRTLQKCKKSHKQYSELLYKLIHYGSISNINTDKLQQQLFDDKLLLSQSLQRQIIRSSIFSRQGSVGPGNSSDTDSDSNININDNKSDNKQKNK
eukprot:143898_1